MHVSVTGSIPPAKYVFGPILAERNLLGAAPVISVEEYDSHTQP